MCEPSDGFFSNSVTILFVLRKALLLSVCIQGWKPKYYRARAELEHAKTLGVDKVNEVCGGLDVYLCIMYSKRDCICAVHHS